MYDLHVHTTYSPDGQSAIEEYVNGINKGKVNGIGFAEHLDFMPECGAYKYLDYDSYITSIEEYREKGYKLLAGAEVDYASHVEKDIVKALHEMKFDFTICSVHVVNSMSVSDKKSIKNFEDPEIFNSIIERYYYEIASCLKVEEFDIIGHIGIYKRYLSQDYLKNRNLWKRIIEMEDEIARKCALSGKIIEVNTSGLFSQIGTTIPDRSFLEAYCQYGGKRVSIGSDAHNVLHLGRGIDKATEMVKSLGLGLCNPLF